MMTNFSLPFTAMRRLALPLAAAALLSACAPTFEARVARFSSLPTPPAKTFYVEPANQANVGGLEFGTYANLIKQQMLSNGFTEVGSAGASDVTVLLDYYVGPPQQRIQTRPGAYAGWGGGWGASPWGWNPYWGRGGWGGVGWGGAWGPGWGGGWGGGWGAPEVYSVTEYTTVMAMKMVRSADKQSLFEGRADTTSRSSNLPALMPNLVRAMFTRFPGTNGEAVRVRFNPNDPAAVPSVSPLR